MDYIPQGDEAARTWMLNYASVLSASPAAYAISSADAANITAAVQSYADALTVALAPATRNTHTLIAKDQTRASAESLCRRFAQLIKQNAGVSGQAKQAAGVPQINTTREPVPPPTTYPVLQVVGCLQGAQTLRYQDSVEPTTRGKKPFGVNRLDLFCVVSDAAVAEFTDEARYVGAYTKNPIGVAFDASEDGKVATYFGRWATTKGDAGPMGGPVSFRIAA